MARYDSLLSRSAAPLRSDMDNSMSRGMNEQNLPPNLSTDPLDFFGAIRDLVEQSIPQPVSYTHLTLPTICSV